jgi:hypothetical protein
MNAVAKQRVKRRSLMLASMAILAPTGVGASAGAVQLVYVGARECPWCVRWMRDEKPRLVASPVFRHLTYVEIEPRRIRDAYEPRYWPAQLVPILRSLPLKDGTPRFLILRDGALYANHLGGWENVMPQLRRLTGSA